MTLAAAPMLPLWATPSYEFALVCACLLAPIAPYLGVRCARGQRSLRILLTIWGVLLAYMASASALGLGCNFVRGVAFFVLLPVVGSAWGFALGALCGVAVPRFAAPLAFALPWLMLVRVLLRFLCTPTIKFFEPLWSYFSGSLYDELIDVTRELWLWRLGSLAEIAAMLAAIYLWPRARESMRLDVRNVALGLVATVFISTSVAEYAAALAPTRAQVLRHLACTIVRPGVVVHLPSNTPQALAEQIGDDHALVIAQLTARMQLGLPRTPLHSFVFADAQDKAAWMGGRNTMVAKPWRGEMYLHNLEVPHTLLPHEAVHALARAWTRQPLGVPARLGIWADMGLIEGVAVALAPNQSALGVVGEAHALLELGLLLPSDALMGRSPSQGLVGFWRQPPARAYGQSGALLRFVMQQHGIGALRALYGGASLADVVRASPAALDAAFAQSLRDTPLPDGGLELVRGPLSQPSIFERRCVHEVARLRQQAHAEAQPSRALGLWRAAKDASGGETQDVLGEARALRASGNEPAAERLERNLVAAGRVAAPQAAELHVLWGLARAAGHDDVAAARQFAQALRWPLPLPATRAAYVLQWAMDQAPRIRDVVVALLRDELGADAAARLRELRDDVAQRRMQARDIANVQAMLSLLLGRQLARTGHPQEALAALHAAGEQTYAPLELERLRLMATLAGQQNQRTDAMALWQQLERKSTWPGLRSHALDWQRRLAATSAK